MREVGDVHRELYATHGELYGENIAGKVERCLAISDGEYSAAQRARVEHAERAHEALAALRPRADADARVRRARRRMSTRPSSAAR